MTPLKRRLVGSWVVAICYGLVASYVASYKNPLATSGVMLVALLLRSKLRSGLPEPDSSLASRILLCAVLCALIAVWLPQGDIQIALSVLAAVAFVIVLGLGIKGEADLYRRLAVTPST